ncbi:hypothetical protein N7513_002546 [Penicillium frequentans]|nr:hypothetical protein N7513_002546 [Penicillium glabrum]
MEEKDSDNKNKESGERDSIQLTVIDEISCVAMPSMIPRMPSQRQQRSQIHYRLAIVTYMAKVNDNLPCYL